MSPRSSQVSKRRLLQFAGSLFIVELIRPLSKVSASLIVNQDRPYWRFCNKCYVMFYTDANSNSCAAGGTHVPQGYEFRLPFGSPETSTAQQNWRCCKKCQAMFFNGYSGKGRCPAGGSHVADNTFLYVLPHDVPGTPTAQTDWRFCNKCQAMFYDGYPEKGRCAAGGSHVAQGYNFVLPHSR
ncbi:hypothetical protein NIES592_23195 [Fischerella major NIES-592]|uniref:Uncharacterized protein n=2 Tax=Fischerella TaxID=1190 RepID=A0A1U7GSZ3_9CYAN|nr:MULTISPECIES: hypothetical protein [Fischerella]BCX08329.1 MAG: hypothetical protein KatS3mg066_2188 [Fischerella sp.]OKH10988.1 hypothetical protein NIES592_23195 [Fischerella major NIES-592]PMB31712.1 hypothetical protein CEN43_13850 [Fischerella thermalis BR2B]PMB34865.1 hypothetical protein CEN42_07900 [Fischerella thermalis CCMEE 5208]PMB42574.1 hypothetical protein CEN41_14875 [Fischerella thermalis CCMEE 5330]